MRRTPTYKLGYYRDGNIYSASLDRTRFITLDYNLQTYIGIVGNGVIGGWDIQVVSGRTVRITPGSGFMDGLYGETQYYLDPTTGKPKKRSQALSAGDTIVEQIPGWSSGDGSQEGLFYDLGGSPYTSGKTFKQLGPDGEDSNYDGIADGPLTPHYQAPPPGFFDDPFVKAVSNSANQLVLVDNTDNYIYAERISNEPSSTFVKFSSSTTPSSSNLKVLVGRVTVRLDAVVDIDYSETFRLSGFEGVIAKDGKQKIVMHNHGGTKIYDPPKVVLTTDMRNTKLFDYSNGKASFRIISNNTTDAAEDHRHYYEVDTDGNGYTAKLVGVYPEHYHDIENNITTTTIAGYGASVVAHTHSIDVSEQKLWSSSDKVNVYINGELANPSTYVLDEASGTVTFNTGLIDVLAPIYSSSFAVDQAGTMYTYSLEAYSFQNFYLNMTSDFYKKYTDKMVVYADTPDGTQTIRDPFTFYQVDGQDCEIDLNGYVVYTSPIPIWQPLPASSGQATTFSSETAQQDGEAEVDILPFREALDQQTATLLDTLSHEGETFTLLPYLAKFVPVTLVREAHVDQVSVEIVMGEVQGIIGEENIFFVRAEKFNEGVFEQTRIPLLNHTGRFDEAFLPTKVRLLSNNGVEFSASPATLDVSQGHGHRVFVDKDNNGTTLATTVNGEIAVWVDNDGEIVNITHSHTVVNNVVQETESAGINSWQGLAEGTKHTHEIASTNMGNSFSAFCVAGDEDGNVYLGTSQGLAVVPVANAYKILVNYQPFYDYNVSVEEAVSRAIARYADDTGDEVSSEYASYIAEATAATAVTGGAYDFAGTTPVTIVRMSYALVDDFYSDSIKEEGTLTKYETVVRTVTIDPNSKSLQSTVEQYGPFSNQVTQAVNSPTFDDDQEPVVVFKVRDDYRKYAVWDIAIKDGLIHATTQRGVVVGQHNSNWVMPSAPASIAISRKSIKDGNGDLWLTSNNGLAVSRYYDGNSSFLFPNKTLENVEVYGMVDAGDDTLLVCSTAGVHSVEDLGATVTLVLNNQNVISLSRDYAQDITSVNSGHTHTFDVDMDGNGTTSLPSTGAAHTHVVANWVVEIASGHQHHLITTIYALATNGSMLKSTDSGQTWTTIGNVSFSYSEINGVHAAFGEIYIPSDNGLWHSSDDGVTWEKKSTAKIYGSGWSWDIDSFYFSGDGIVLHVENGSNPAVLKLFSGEPFPTFYQDGGSQVFGYAYVNSSKLFFMWSIPQSDSYIEAALNYNVWTAERGAWSDTTPYDIIVDGKRVLSTKDDIDRRNEYGINFTVTPTSGRVDFSFSSNLSSKISSGDIYVIVGDTSGFAIGSSIQIQGEESSISAVVKTIVDATTLEIDSFADQAINIPATVSVLSSLQSTSVVSGNIYESDLYNIGEKTHQEIEDGLADLSSGLPAKMEDSYLTNLSETVIAVKYALPTIDELLKNWSAYMMSYSRNPSDPNYIGNSFDLQTTEFNSRITYSRQSSFMGIGSVNAVALGYDTLDGIVFAATTSGLFYARKYDNWEGCWIPFVQLGSMPVYDILIVNGRNLLAATLYGLWGTVGGDLTIWEKKGFSISGGEAAYFVKPRWVKSEAGTPYWWNSWQQTTSPFGSQITNDIMVGGKGYMMKSNDNGASWVGIRTAAKVSETETVEFSTDHCMETLLPTSDGRALMAVNSKSADRSTYIVAMTDTGDSMKVLETIDGYSGKILSVRPNDAYNTEVTVGYTSPSTNPSVKDNSMIGLQMVVGSRQWYVVANHDDKIILFGEEPARYVKADMTFSLPPLSVKRFLQTRDSRILVGTNTGMLEDDKSYFALERATGVVSGVNKSATINSIDATGTVISLSKDISQVGEVVTDINNTETTTISVTLDRIVTVNELAGQTLRVVDGALPTVTILSPSPNQTLSSSSITVSVAVTSFDTKSSGYIAFQVDGGTVTYSRSTTQSVSGLANGQHKVKVYLVDQKRVQIPGNQAVKEVVFSVSTATTEPSVKLLYPTTGQVVATPNIVVQAQLSNFTPADGKVYYTLDSASRVEVPFTEAGNIEISLLNLAQGDHSVKVYLTDLSDNDLGVLDEAKFSVSLTNDAIIQITTPVSGSLLAWNYVDITYSISNFDVPGQGAVKIYLDSVAVATSTSPTTASIFNIADGVHKVKVELVDDNGNKVSGNFSSSEVSITINTSTASVPRIQIASPLNGLGYAAGTQSVQLAFQYQNFSIPEDGGVFITVNGTGTFINSPDGVTTYTMWTVDGSYSVVATLAKDANTLLTNAEATATTSFTVGEVTRSVETSRGGASTFVSAPTSVPEAKDVDDLSSSSSTEGKQGWRIKSNTSATANGTTSITLEVTVDDSILFQTVKIVPDQTTLFVAFDQPVSVGEFNGGTLYVDPLEDNAGKQYQIDSNTKTYIRLSEVIDDEARSSDSSDALSDIIVGQKVFLVPQSELSTLWVSPTAPLKKNSLAGETITINHEDSTLPPVTAIVVSNTTRSLVLNADVDPSTIFTNDSYTVSSVTFSPLESFAKKETSVNLDHYHGTDLVNRIVSGNVTILALASAAKVNVFVSNTVNFDLSLIQGNPTLLQGATIIFQDPQNPSVVYEEVVDSVASNKVVVKVSDASHWNLNGSSPLAISPGFTWEIDASLYGVTSTINYDDFSVMMSSLTDDGTFGATSIKIPSTVGVVATDQIEIFDSSGSSQTTTVSLVDLDGITLHLSNALSKTYRVSSGAAMKIRRDVYLGASHSHVVRAGEVYSAYTPWLRELGYSDQHNHMLEDLVAKVDAMLSDEAGTISVSGTGSVIWNSTDLVQSWKVLVDVNDVREGADEATGVGSLTFDYDSNNPNDNRLLAGVYNGYVVAQVPAPGDGADPIDVPVFEMSSSSSSDSSSDSSSSSSTSLSSASSRSSVSSSS